MQPIGVLPQADGLDFALHPSRTAGFDLLRNVPDDTFGDRHTGRRKTQHLAFAQGSGQFDAVQPSLDNQFAAGASASTASGSS